MGVLVKRHWQGLLVTTTLCLLITYWVTQSYFLGQRGRALGQEASPPTSTTLDPMTYSKVQELRDKVCLTNADLAAMGCDQQTAQNVLSALLNWYQSNRAELETREQTALDARRSFNDVVQAINVGPRDDAKLAQFPTLQQQAANAAAQRDDLVQSAIQALAAQLSADQNQLWAVARANAPTSGSYRYVPGITKEQVTRLSQSVDPLSDQVLTADQKQAFDAAVANSIQTFPAVTAAEAIVFPLPDTKPPTTAQASTQSP